MSNVFNPQGLERCFQEAEHESSKAARAFGRVLRTAACSSSIYRDLFLRRVAVPTSALSRLARSEKELKEDLEASIAIGLLESSEDQQLTSTVMVHYNPMDIEGHYQNPCESWFIATDWPDVPPDHEAIGNTAVFPIHYESIYLLRALKERVGGDSEPFLGGKRVLDPFCGSGILGIFAAIAGADYVECWDLSSRALAFARLNVVLNKSCSSGVRRECGPEPEEVVHSTVSLSPLIEDEASADRDARLDSIRFVLRDATEAVDGNGFDLVLANPPFEPEPVEAQVGSFLHSAGGHTGLSVVRSCLDRAASWLSDDGMLLAVAFALGDDKGKTALKAELDVRPGFSERALDWVPLRHFADQLPGNAQQPVAYGAWVGALEKAGYSRLYLVLIESGGETGAAIAGGRAVPYDWTVPLHWYCPCGHSLDGARRVKVLLVDPPMHSYFHGEAVISDQGQRLDLPLNMLCLGTHLKRGFPDQVDVRVLHFDYELLVGRGSGDADETDEPVAPDRDSLLARMENILEDCIERFQPDVVGVGALTIQADLAREILKVAREAGRTYYWEPITIAGGPHVTFEFAEFFGDVLGRQEDPVLDFAVMGEGEYALSSLVRGLLLRSRAQLSDRSWRHGLVAAFATGARKLPPNTMMNPKHSREQAVGSELLATRTRAADLLPMDLSLLGDRSQRERFIRNANIIIHTKRGCSNHCEFCISKRFFREDGSRFFEEGGADRAEEANGRKACREVVRPVQYVLEEIRSLREYGPDSVEILDEVFRPAQNSQHRALCEALAGRGFEGMRFVVQTRADKGHVNPEFLSLMRAARITTVLFGIESASSAVLRIMQKEVDHAEMEQAVLLAKRWGFRTGMFWILGFPGAQPAHDRLTFEKIKEWSAREVSDWNEVNIFVPYPGTPYHSGGPVARADGAGETNLEVFGAADAPYEEWLRFGKVWSEDAERDATPVYKTDGYPVEELVGLIGEIEDWKSSSGYGDSLNPSVIPLPPDVIRTKAMSLAAEFGASMAQYFEQQMVKLETSGDTEEVDSLETIARALPIVREHMLGHDEVKRQVPSEMASHMLQTFTDLNQMLRMMRCQITSCFIVPFTLDEQGRAGMVRAGGGAASQSVTQFVASQADAGGWRVEQLNLESEGREEGSDDLFFLHYYATFADERRALETAPVATADGGLFFHRRDSILSALGELHSRVSSEHDASCTTSWGIGVGMTLFPGAATDDSERDQIGRSLVASGIDGVLVIILETLMSQLAGLLNSRLQSVDNEDRVMKKQAEMASGIVRLFPQAGFESVVRSRGRAFCDGVRQLTAEASLPSELSDDLVQYADGFVRFVLEGKWTDADGEVLWWSPRLGGERALAQSLANVMRVSRANISLLRKLPEQPYGEHPSEKDTLAECILSDVVGDRSYFQEWKEKRGLNFWLVVGDPPGNRFSLNESATAEGDALLLAALRQWFQGTPMPIPRGVLFSVLLKEALGNAVTLSADSDVEILCGDPATNAGGEVISFEVACDVASADITSRARLVETGLSRMRTALAVNMGLDELVLEPNFIGHNTHPAGLRAGERFSHYFRLDLGKYVVEARNHGYYGDDLV